MPDAVQLVGLPQPFNTALSVAGVWWRFDLLLGPQTILDLNAAQWLSG